MFEIVDDADDGRRSKGIPCEPEGPGELTMMENSTFPFMTIFGWLSRFVQKRICCVYPLYTHWVSYDRYHQSMLFWRTDDT